MRAAAIYARVSTSDQVRGTSLDSQVDACREYAEKQSYTVVKVVREDASGARLDRTGLGELRDMASRREIHALVIFDPDRLSRSLPHMMLLCEEFERQQVTVAFVNAPREDTPEGKMLFGMRSLFAEYERAKILERTRRGKERRAKDGQVVRGHYLPFGYTYDISRRTLVIDETRSQYVRSIYAWAVDGLTVYAIAQRLNGSRVPTPRGGAYWDPSTVAFILHHEVYAGKWHYNKNRVGTSRYRIGNDSRSKEGTSTQPRPQNEWIAVTVPAIIDEKLFKEAQARLKRNGQLSRRNSKHYYLLSGIFFCRLCGRRLCGRTIGQGKQYPYYNCRGRSMAPSDMPHLRCNLPYLRTEEIERLLWDEVVSQVGDPDLIRKTLAEEGGLSAPAQEAMQRTLHEVEGRERQADREAERLLDLYLGEHIDLGTFNSRMTGIQKRLEAAHAEADEIRQQLGSFETLEETVEQMEERFAKIREGLPHMDFAGKREFLLDYGIRVETDAEYLYVGGLIRPVRIPLPPLAKTTQQRKQVKTAQISLSQAA